ncbi:hypothetical protein Cgig2_013594 [Carnegiea gigantea]|uniref:Uncharacterized protein n=1 Tax=Carnegiea gigantea TaxID=171969 RepID=A0A9Q1KBS5_9CARY|nr:hypothetical protein Cgig2_013594 [Carnegiea gigantea]
MEGEGKGAKGVGVSHVMPQKLPSCCKGHKPAKFAPLHTRHNKSLGEYPTFKTAMASALFSRILFSSRFFHSPRSLFRKPQFSSQIFHTRPFNSRAVEFSQYKLRTHLVCCVILSTNVEAKSYCTRAMSTNEPMVLVEWLHANLREPDIKVLSLVVICSKNALHYFFPIKVLIGLAFSVHDMKFC